MNDHGPKRDLIHHSIVTLLMKQTLYHQATRLDGYYFLYFRKQIFQKGTKIFELLSSFMFTPLLFLQLIFSHFYVSDLGLIAVERDENKCQLNVKGNHGKNKGKK